MTKFCCKVVEYKPYSGRVNVISSDNFDSKQEAEQYLGFVVEKIEDSDDWSVGTMEICEYNPDNNNVLSIWDYT